MKTKVLGLLVGILLSVQSFAGGESGNGGDGYSLLFTSTAIRIHREFLMEQWENIIQARDVIPLTEYLTAVNFTKVISTDSDVVDTHGNVQAAIFLNPDNLKIYGPNYGMTSSQVDDLLETAPLGAIIINRERIREELALGMSIFMGTVFHEYLRVMGINDDNYINSAIAFDREFFEGVYQKSSYVTVQTLETLSNNITVSQTKFELIDAELNRLDIEIAEDIEDLEVVLESKMARARQLRRQINREFQAISKVVGSTGMVPMPFGSYRSRVVSAMGKYVAEAPVGETKRQQYQVMQEQAEFLFSKLRINREHYLRVQEKRNEIFMDLLNE